MSSKQKTGGVKTKRGCLRDTTHQQAALHQLVRLKLKCLQRKAMKFHRLPKWMCRNPKDCFRIAESGLFLLYLDESVEYLATEATKEDSTPE